MGGRYGRVVGSVPFGVGGGQGDLSCANFEFGGLLKMHFEQLQGRF